MPTNYSSRDVEALVDMILGEVAFQGGTFDKAEAALMVSTVLGRTAENGRSITDELTYGGFYGYTNPGAAQQRNQQNERWREEARPVVTGVLNGSITPPKPVGWEGATLPIPSNRQGMDDLQVGTTRFFFQPGMAPSPRSIPTSDQVAAFATTGRAPTSSDTSQGNQPTTARAAVNDMAGADLSNRTITGYIAQGGGQGGGYTLGRGSNFNGRVDPRLMDIVETAASRFPLQVEAVSGRAARASGTQNHPHGWAIDVRIYGPDGKPLPNYQNASSFRTYEQFAQVARQVQQEKYPELNRDFRWGGYFGGRFGWDQMHLDINPNYKGAAARGSWEEGLTERGSKMRGAESVGMNDPRWSDGLAPAGNTALAFAEEPNEGSDQQAIPLDPITVRGELPGAPGSPVDISDLTDAGLPQETPQREAFGLQDPRQAVSGTMDVVNSGRGGGFYDEDRPGVTSRMDTAFYGSAPSTLTRDGENFSYSPLLSQDWNTQGSFSGLFQGQPPPTASDALSAIPEADWTPAGAPVTTTQEANRVPVVEINRSAAEQDQRQQTTPIPVRRPEIDPEDEEEPTRVISMDPEAGTGGGGGFFGGLFGSLTKDGMLGGSGMIDGWGAPGGVNGGNYGGFGVTGYSAGAVNPYSALPAVEYGFGLG